MLAIIPKTINASLAPLRQWIAQREYNVAETEKILAIKLEKVDANKIVTPEAYVAVPALQAISYSMHNVELREMYANLLAKSMNIDTKDRVHPGFVEIIKQLSPIDAKIFKIIMGRKENPIVHLNLKSPNSKGSIPVLRNYTGIDVADIKSVGMSIDSLCKQGLISIPIYGAYTNDVVYDKILNTEYYKELKKVNGDLVNVVKLHINKTEYGNDFFDICVKE